MYGSIKGLVLFEELSLSLFKKDFSLKQNRASVRLKTYMYQSQNNVNTVKFNQYLLVIGQVELVYLKKIFYSGFTN